MKRLFCLFLALSLCLLALSGCSDPSAKFDEQELKNKSIAYSEQMNKGDFTTVTQDFSDVIKNKLTDTQLKDGWKQTAGTIGKFKQVHSTDFKATPTSAQVIVTLEFEKRGLTVSFTYDKNNKISGLWLNYATLATNLTNNTTLQEHAIEVPSDKISLTGILTLPKQEELKYVAIFVHGSGSSDYDQTIKDNKPFKDIAHDLAKKGIGTIRYNKRFFQNPGLAGSNYTVEDEVLTDVKAAIQFAKSEARLEGKPIIIIGHSFGGMLAPKISKDNQEVKAIVSLAGSPRKLEDIIYDQQKAVIDKEGSKLGSSPEKLLSTLKEEIQKIKNLKEDDNSSIMNISASYWRSLNKIDTPSIVKEINIPILVMQGSADFQVTKTDYNAWKTVLKGKKNVTFKLYNNLNHLFMKTNGKTDITEYDKKGTVDKTVTNDLANWILNLK